VARRLAAIAAMLVGLGLLILAAAQWRSRDPEPIAAEPRELSARPASAGEASQEGEEPASEATEPNDPSTNEAEVLDELLDPWRDTDTDPSGPTSGPMPAPRESDLMNPFESELRIPEVFRGARGSRAPTATSPDLLDPFSRSEPRRLPSVRRPTARRPSTSGTASDLLDPFTRPARATTPSRSPAPSPASTAPTASSGTNGNASDASEGHGERARTENDRTANEVGTIVINAVPWARVLVDGRDVGNTPIRLEVPVGERQVELRFSNGVVRRAVVEVHAGQTHRLTHDGTR
jgi:hypothetical protein